MAAVLDRYEEWLLSSGLQFLRQQTKEPKDIRPAPSEPGLKPLLWRSIGVKHSRGTISSVSRVIEGLAGDDGYALTHSSGRPNAVYLPALQQVWVQESAAPEAAAAILAHELLHVYSTGLQPAMLHPLRNHLLGVDQRPNAREFRDIVESLAAVLLPVLQGRPAAKRSIVATKDGCAELAVLYIDIARQLAASSSQTRRQCIREALYGVGFVMMHVVPFREGQATYVLHLLKKCKPRTPWTTRWDLFLQLHAELAQRQRVLPRARDAFSLAMPVDVHRTIGEAAMFLSGALLSAKHRPEQFIGAVPTIALVLTMGSLTVLPLIYLDRTKRGYGARIRVIHTTSRSEPKVRRVVAEQTKQLARKEAAGKSCFATTLLLETLQNTLPFRLSHDRSRLAGCLASLLDSLPSRFRQFVTSRPCCPGCQMLLGDPHVRAAADHVARMPTSQRDAFLAMAEGYEGWLREGCMTLLAGKHNLDAPLRSVRAYRFL